MYITVITNLQYFKDIFKALKMLNEMFLQNSFTTLTETFAE